MTPMHYTLIITALVAIAFTSGKVNFTLVCVLCMLALNMTGVMNVQQAFGGFCNSNVILIAAMFVITKALNKTSLMGSLTGYLGSAKGNERKLVLICCLIGVAIGVVSSGVTAAIIMLPLISGLAKELNSSRSRYMWPITVCASMGMASTILGNGSTNLAANDIMLNAGGGQIPFVITDFTIGKLPLIIVTVLYCVFIGYKMMPVVPEEQLEKLNAKSLDSQLSPRKNALAITIVLLTLVGILVAGYIKIPVHQIAIIGACLMVIFGILKPDEALASIHQPTIFLFAATLQLSAALGSTGAGDLLANVILKVLGNTRNEYFIIAVFFLFSFIATQFMSNLAVYTLMGPLVCATAVALGADCRAALMIVNIASTSALLTPMASPAMAVIYGPCGYSMKDWIKAGLPLGLIIMIVSIIWIPIVFPLF